MDWIQRVEVDTMATKATVLMQPALTGLTQIPLEIDTLSSPLFLSLNLLF